MAVLLKVGKISGIRAEALKCESFNEFPKKSIASCEVINEGLLSATKQLMETISGANNLFLWTFSGC
jgi:hypothetical protein